MQSNRHPDAPPRVTLRNGLMSAVLTLGAATAFAQAGDAREAAAASSIDELKRVYLACDRAASRYVLDPSAAAHCSIVGETLKQRGFGGSFEQLLAWWRAEKDRVTASADAAPTSRSSE